MAQDSTKSAKARRRMAKLTSEFNYCDAKEWTTESVAGYFKNKLPCNTPALFFKAFFGWSLDEYERALDIAEAEGLHQGILPCHMMDADPASRLKWEQELIRLHPDVFLNRHCADPKSWFTALVRSGAYFQRHCALQRFISHVTVVRKTRKQQLGASKDVQDWLAKRRGSSPVPGPDVKVASASGVSCVGSDVKIKVEED